jgi:hypothetical protein
VLKLDWTTSEKSYPAFLSLNHKRRKKFQELDNYKICAKKSEPRAEGHCMQMSSILFCEKKGGLLQT